MTSGELLLVFRSDMGDQARPYLWTDVDFYGYLDDAQMQFCRQTDGIPDGRTPEVTQLAIAENATWVGFHPAILKVRSCARVDNGRPVELLNNEDLAGRGTNWYVQAGPVRALVIGENSDDARVVPRSSEAVTLQLIVFRLPLESITDDQELEIPAEHHLGLLLWCKYRAYSKSDAETFDKQRATDMYALFGNYCVAARQLEERRRFKPRVVAYGGI